jgi:hypothetical protein
MPKVAPGLGASFELKGSNLKILKFSIPPKGKNRGAGSLKRGK